MNLFDYAKSAKLSDDGIARVTSHPNDEWVKQAKELAVVLAERLGEVTINDVLKLYPKPDHIHHNAIGGVMRDKRLKRIGYKKSEKVTAHARPIGIYVLSDFCG